MEEILPVEQPHALSEPVDPPLLPQAPHTPATIANEPTTLGPWYHTVGIVLVLLLYALLAHLAHRGPGTASRVEQGVSETARAIADAPKVPLYSSNILLSWMLLASTVVGLYHRRTFFLTTLRRRFPSRWVDPALGVSIYLTFLGAVAMFMLLFTSILLTRTHAHTPRATMAATNAQPTQPASKSADVASTVQETQAVQERVQHLLHLDQSAVAALAPQTLPELLLWIVLSFTAGFCEEHIFRGYLLGQSLAAMRRLAMPAWLAATLSVLATSVLFGSLHLYEGVGGAVLVGLLGALLAAVTLKLGNLRAVIVAHFLQDFLGGLVYYIAHLRHAV